VKSREFGPFVKGDQRINRAKPGSRRPPLWWRQALAWHELTAVATIGREGR